MKSLFKQGAQDHDDGFDRHEVEDRIYQDSDEENRNFNEKAARKEWLKGWDWAESMNPMDERRRR